MRTDERIRTVDIDLDRVLWDAEYRRRVIESLKRRRESSTDDPPPTDERGGDSAKGNSSPHNRPK